MKKTEDNPSPTSPTNAPSPVLRTPSEWARELGCATKARVQLPGIEDPVHPFHAAADALHGWSHDAHNNQGAKTFRLSEADYRAALAAAADHPCTPAHGPAVAPSCPHDHRSFRPRRRRAGSNAQPKSNWRSVATPEVS